MAVSCHRTGGVKCSGILNDNAEALKIILTQEKEPGVIQFKAGAAILNRSEVDDFRNLPGIKGKLTYERKAVPGNDYHGNLLLLSDVPKYTMKQIAATLALLAHDCVKPE